MGNNHHNKHNVGLLMGPLHLADDRGEAIDACGRVADGDALSAREADELPVGDALAEHSHALKHRLRGSLRGMLQKCSTV